MSYCTAANIKLALDISGANYDTLLTSLANSASDWIDQYCNMPANGFAVVADTTQSYGIHSMREDGSIKLDQPLISLTSVTNADGTSIPVNRLRLWPLNYPQKWRIRPLQQYGYTWVWVTDGLITVTGKFGWSTTAPAGVVEACTMLSAWMFKRYQAALQDSGDSSDTGEYQFGKAIPKNILDILSPYQPGTMML